MLMKNKLDFFTLILLYLVLFVGLTKFIFKVSGWKFYLELIVLLGLLFFAFLSTILIFNKIKIGYTLSALVSAVVLLNLILFYLKANISTLMFLSIISAITAFVISVVNIGQKKVIMEKPIPKEKPVLKTYTPGKVVSSKTSNYFHVPKCDWAKKIKKANRTWFNSEEDAKKEGLKPHNCAK